MAESRGTEVRVLVVGDELGAPQLLRVLPPGSAVGMIAAANRPRGHDRMKCAATEHGIPLLVQPPPASVAYPAFVDAVAELRPNLILSNSYSMVLREEVLELASRGAVNVHGGKLPEYRGANPIQWAIIEGERETAVTLHHMTSEVDAGDVIAERRVPIRFEDTWRTVRDRLQTATEELLAAELPHVLAGTAKRRAQEEAAARRRPRRTPDDGRIDWGWNVARIYDFVRALGDGIPPAFYEQDGERIEVERLSLGEVAALAFAPGPGGRRLGCAALRLVPTGGGLGNFLVLRNGVRTGTVRLEPVDLEARTARIRLDPEDPEARELLIAFAQDELEFAITCS